MLGKFACLLAALSVAAPATAGALAVRVVDAAGRPVRDAVVRLYPAGAARRPAGQGRFVIAQKNLKFQPFLTIVPVGADISFPNLDPTKHHVYSFSPAKRFELKLFARDQSRTVHFDKPGIVALGCNIHDSMSAYILVTDTAWTVRTNGQGIASFATVPDVPIRAIVWHPYLRARGGVLEQQLRPGQRSTLFAVNLRAPPAMPPMTY